jgi:uncharacterized DUF497 family protein
LRPVPASSAIRSKIEEKHGIGWDEIESCLRRRHLVLRGRTDQYGKRRYASLGRADGDRLLMIVYVVAPPDIARVITAKDMTRAERRRCQQFERRKS